MTNNKKTTKKIKNQKKELIKKVETEVKSGNIILLRDKLNNVLMDCDMNITAKGENILKKLANEERNINYKNLFFKSGSPVLDNYDLFKRFSTLYDLLIDLFSEKIRLSKAAIEQNEMIDKIEDLRSFVLPEEENINEEKNRGAINKAKTKTQKRKTISIQKSVLNNALKLFDKRGVIIEKK